MLAENLSSLGLLLLFEKEFVDVARDASLGDRNLTNQLVQLLIVLNGKLDVSGNNTGLLVLASAVAGKLKQLSNEVFQHGAHENSGRDTDAGGVSALTEVSTDTSDGERET